MQSYDNTSMIIIVGIYLTIEIVNWIYICNCNKWYKITKPYTFYFDVNNKRIPENANVIFYGALYKECWENAEKKDINMNYKELRLISWNNHNSILLEEAVKDREGKLTLEKAKY